MDPSRPPFRRCSDLRGASALVAAQSLTSNLSRWFDHAVAISAATAHESALRRHGDFSRWQQTVDQLPAVAPGWALRAGWLHAGAPLVNREALRDLLQVFIPWRKGPLLLAGEAIETEWRSDIKWNRVAPHLDLVGARVLDVGAGNGYFGWCMLDQGAAMVLGCDPTPLYVMQHAVIRHFSGPAEHELLALRLEELPPALTHFDAVFSMGVLYHRRDPARHLAQLRERLRPGGRLVLETLILPDAGLVVLEPADRYAGMRNVHALPSLPSLLAWLDKAGFREARCLDVSVTTPAEQRSTEWMPFHSLNQALDPVDDHLTVEGLPRPHRAILTALV